MAPRYKQPMQAGKQGRERPKAAGKPVAQEPAAQVACALVVSLELEPLCMLSLVLQPACSSSHPLPSWLAPALHTFPEVIGLVITRHETRA